MWFNVKKIINKLFFYESYSVAYRFLKSSDELLNPETSTYTVLSPKGLYWCADPFPFEYNSKHYIFVELYNLWKPRAELAYYCLEDGDKLTTILEEPFHLSYPNIFDWNGDVYMIPETHNAKQLRLYKSCSFPDKWELDKILLDDVDLADASFYFVEEGLIYIEAMEDIGGNYTNKFYVLEMKDKLIREMEPDSSQFINKRPAGNFFHTKDGCFHALQECSSLYGEYMHICKVDSFQDCCLREHIDAVWKVDMYKFDNTDKTFQRTHTLNRSTDLEVIDLLNVRFSPFLIFCKIYRNLLR